MWDPHFPFFFFLIVKSCSIPFLERTSTMRVKFLAQGNIGDLFTYEHFIQADSKPFYKMLIIYHMCWYIQFGCQLHISPCYWHRCCAVLLILVRNALVILMNISVAIVIGTGVSYSISILLINSLISFGISFHSLISIQ